MLVSQTFPLHKNSFNIEMLVSIQIIYIESLCVLRTLFQYFFAYICGNIRGNLTRSILFSSIKICIEFFFFFILSFTIKCWVFPSQCRSHRDLFQLYYIEKKWLLTSNSWTKYRELHSPVEKKERTRSYLLQASKNHTVRHAQPCGRAKRCLSVQLLLLLFRKDQDWAG